MIEALIWIAIVIGIGLALIYFLKDRFDGLKTIWLSLGTIVTGAMPQITDFLQSLSIWGGDFQWERYVTVRNAGYLLVGFGILAIVNRVFFTSGPVRWKRDDLK